MRDFDLKKLSKGLAPNDSHASTVAVAGALALGAVMFGISLAQEGLVNQDKPQGDKDTTPAKNPYRTNPYRVETVGELEEILLSRPMTREIDAQLRYLAAFPPSTKLSSLKTLPQGL